MSSNLVFITGGSGHVGFRTIVTALEGGYSVRAAVRSESKKDLILSAQSIKALNPKGKLTFTIIPDLSKPGAYDDALAGVDGIIHIASPIPMKAELKPEDYQSFLIDPAIEGTTSILKAAQKTPGIKRVVITSSIVAQVEPKWILEADRPADAVLDYKTRTTFPPGPYPSDFHAYDASKIAALIATEEFVTTQRPAFEVVNIHPSFVIGKNELITKAEDITLGTNALAIGTVLGNKSEIPLVGATVHVNDVASMHVKGLDPKVPAGSYIANSGGDKGSVLQDATAVVAANFPEAVKKGVLPNDGVQPTRKLRVDAKRSEEVMGLKFAEYAEQVRSVVEHYLELKGVEAK